MAPISSERRKVAVIGAGSMGSMAAWQLAKAGHHVVAYDAGTPPHDRGAHAAESRIFRLAYREGSSFIPLLERARQLWAELAATTDDPLVTATGCLYIGQAGAAWLGQTIAGAEKARLDIDVLDDREITRRFPQHVLFGGEHALLDHGGALLRPELAVRAALRESSRLGADLRVGNPVQAIDSSGPSVTVTTSRSRESFDSVVVTTGAWSTVEGLPDLGIAPRRLPAFWYAPEHPRDYLPALFPVCIRAHDDVEYSGFPTVDGWTIKVMPPASAVDQVDVDTLDRSIQSADGEITAFAVAQLLRDVAPAPVRSGVHVDGFTPTGTPVVGPVVEDRVFAAVGFSGHGFKMAPAVGELMVHLTEGRTPPSQPFHLPPLTSTT